VALEDIKARYLTQQIATLKNELSELASEGADSDDLAFKEAELYCDRALDFLGKGDLDTAFYGYMYAQGCVPVLQRELRSTDDLRKSVADLMSRSPLH